MEDQPGCVPHDSGRGFPGYKGCFIIIPLVTWNFLFPQTNYEKQLKRITTQIDSSAFTAKH